MNTSETDTSANSEGLCSPEIYLDSAFDRLPKGTEFSAIWATERWTHGLGLRLPISIWQLEISWNYHWPPIETDPLPRKWPL